MAIIGRLAARLPHSALDDMKRKSMIGWRKTEHLLASDSGLDSGVVVPTYFMLRPTHRRGEPTTIRDLQ
jgi:hypothetical protein